MVLTDISSTKDFLDASIDKVIETLVIALILVVLVVYLFLHDIRTTLIPSISIIVSHIGTLAFLYAVGFTLNMLTLLFARWWGLENNIYMQIGLIMLIGLLAKTAILLTEYASARCKEGLGLVAAAISAAKARFRPIIMTSDTMVFGMLPLMFASGVGANGNISGGTTT